MKSVFEEYGRIIITVAVITVLLGFTLSTEKNGYLGMLKWPESEQTPGSKGAGSIIEEKEAYGKPSLEVITEKLQSSREYDLLSFVTYVADRQGNTDSVKVAVVKIKAPDGKVIDPPEKIKGKQNITFPERSVDNVISLLKGYQITYQAEDSKGNKTEKTYEFVVV